MMMGKIVLAVGAPGLMAGAAEAKIVTVTFSGVVSDDFDDADGIFGPQGGDLTGMTFVSTYQFDTSAGLHWVTPGQSVDIHGGSSMGYPTVLASASITINSHTQSSSGYAFNEIYMNYGGSPQLYVESDDEGMEFYNYLEPTGPSNGWATSNFADFDGDVIGQEGEGYYGIGNSWVYLVNQHLTISSEGAVPEPATWAMILSGFGLVGGALRSRRKMVVSFR